MLQKLESRFASNLTMKLLAGTLPALLLALVASLVACSAPSTPVPIPNQKPTLAQPTEQASFKVLSLAISPPNATNGQPVTISADIANYSANGENYQAELRINNVLEATKVLTIPTGTTQRINFIVSKDKLGSYNVTFGDLNGKFAIADQGNAVQINSPNANSPANTATASCCDPKQTNSSPSSSCCGTPSQPSSTGTSQSSSPNTSQWGRSSGGGCCGR